MINPFILRPLSESLILIGSAMFGATFKPDYTCLTSVNFVTLKDGSLEINSLAL